MKPAIWLLGLTAASFAELPETDLIPLILSHLKISEAIRLSWVSKYLNRLACGYITDHFTKTAFGNTFLDTAKVYQEYLDNQQDPLKAAYEQLIKFKLLPLETNGFDPVQIDIFSTILFFPDVGMPFFYDIEQFQDPLVKLALLLMGKQIEGLGLPKHNTLAEFKSLQDLESLACLANETNYDQVLAVLQDYAARFGEAYGKALGINLLLRALSAGWPDELVEHLVHYSSIHHEQAEHIILSLARHRRNPAFYLAIRQKYPSNNSKLAAFEHALMTGAADDDIVLSGPYPVYAYALCWASNCSMAVQDALAEQELVDDELHVSFVLVENPQIVFGKAQVVSPKLLCRTISTDYGKLLFECAMKHLPWTVEQKWELVREVLEIGAVPKALVNVLLDSFKLSDTPRYRDHMLVLAHSIVKNKVHVRNGLWHTSTELLAACFDDLETEDLKAFVNSKEGIMAVFYGFDSLFEARRAIYAREGILYGVHNEIDRQALTVMLDPATVRLEDVKSWIVNSIECLCLLRVGRRDVSLLPVTQHPEAVLYQASLRAPSDALKPLLEAVFEYSPEARNRMVNFNAGTMTFVHEMFGPDIILAELHCTNEFWCEWRIALLYKWGLLDQVIRGFLNSGATVEWLEPRIAHQMHLLNDKTLLQ